MERITPIRDLLNSIGDGASLTLLKEELEILLKEERIIIQQAFEDGHRQGKEPNRKLLASLYYKEEFKNN